MHGISSMLTLESQQMAVVWTQRSPGQSIKTERKKNNSNHNNYSEKGPFSEIKYGDGVF